MAARRHRAGRPFFLITLAAVLAPLLITACDNPPQIVEIEPARGAQEVRSNQPVRIRFDHAVDRASVAARFTITPAIAGQIRWETADVLVFEHATFKPDTDYEVALAPGYRDTAGHANGLRHSWRFRTESAPTLRSTTPGDGDSGVDPAAYISFTFSREIDATSFQDAITISPAASYSVRADPGDAHRLLVAPRRLLDPATEYTVTVAGTAEDVDGNRTPAVELRFTTGSPRPLTRWMTFVASGADPATSGVWMVDELGFPRKLEDGPVADFALAPEGGGVLVQRPDESWDAFDLAGTPFPGVVTGTWAAQIGAGDYAYLEAGRLVRRLPDGSDVAVDNGVVDAAVSPDDSRLAYVVTTPSGAEIRGYDLGLRAHYRIAAESGPVTALVWSASGNRVAYLLGSPLAGDRELRVRPLSGSGTPVTVARGDIADPRWLGGGDDLVFAAEVATASGLQSRIFRVSLAAPLTGTLSAAGSLATGLDAAMSSPRPSLDGHQVAVLVGEPESAQVWVMNSDGTGLHRLTAYDADSFPFVCRDLHWAT